MFGESGLFLRLVSIKSAESTKRQGPTQTMTEKKAHGGNRVTETNIPNFDLGTNQLLPAIAQDAKSGEVLMMAWMNKESYLETLSTRRAVYFSRSRQKLWRKGEESGHVQSVESIFVDCDADTILLKVRQTGAACHEGYTSCFYRRVSDNGIEIIGNRLADPADIYQQDTQKESDN